MTKRFRKTCFALVLSFAALLFAPITASACTCSLPPIGKTEKQLIKLERKKSQAIFAGEVEAVIVPRTPSGEESWTAEVHLKVLQTWKGAATQRVIVFTSNSNGSCGYKFTVGERYLVYAYGSGGDLATSFCTRTKALSEANDDLKVLGKSNVPKS